MGNQDFDDPADCRIGETVMDCLTFAPRLHQSLLSQPRQMLGKCRLGEGHMIQQSPNAELSHPKSTKDHQAAFMRHGLEQSSGLASALCHTFGISNLTELLCHARHHITMF
jgi:hypothetical protein